MSHDVVSYDVNREPFQSTPTTPDTNRFGMRLSLLIVILTGTLVRSKGQFTFRLQPNNINRDSGIEIPEAWMLTIKKHNNRRVVRQ